MTLRVSHARVQTFGRQTAVIEHVTLSDVLEAWMTVLEAAGIDPERPDADAALRNLLARANIVRMSTPGEVYRAENARTDLAQALGKLGIEPVFFEPAPAVVH